MKIIFLLITLFAFANGGEEFDKKIGRKAIEEIEEDSGLRIQDSYITKVSEAPEEILYKLTFYAFDSFDLLVQCKADVNYRREVDQLEVNQYFCGSNPSKRSGEETDCTKSEKESILDALSQMDENLELPEFDFPNMIPPVPTPKLEITNVKECSRKGDEFFMKADGTEDGVPTSCTITATQEFSVTQRQCNGSS